MRQRLLFWRLHAPNGPHAPHCQSVSQSVSNTFSSRRGLIRCLATIVWPATNKASQRNQHHQSRIIQHIRPNSMQSITPNASISKVQTPSIWHHTRELLEDNPNCMPWGEARYQGPRDVHVTTDHGSGLCNKSAIQNCQFYINLSAVSQDTSAILYYTAKMRIFARCGGCQGTVQTEYRGWETVSELKERLVGCNSAHLASDLVGTSNKYFR